MNGKSEGEERLLDELAKLRRQIRELETAQFERKQVEDMLWASNELLEKIFSTTQFAIAYIDTDCNFICVNRAYAAAEGRDPEFFEGKNYFDLYPSEKKKSIFRQVVETGEPYVADAKSRECVQGPGRGVTYWDWTLHPIRDSTGEVEGLLLCLVNVTERKRADEALRASESEKKAILDVSMDRIRLVDTEMRIIWANRTTAKEINASPEDLIGQPCFQVFAGESAPCTGCPTTMALKSGRIEHATLRRFNLKGIKGEVYWDGYAVPIRDESGEVAKVVQVFRNITKRKKGEAALRESEERFRSIFESSEDAICVIDDQGLFLIVNDAMCRLTGVARQQLVGEHYSIFVDKDTHEMLERYRLQRIQGGSAPSRYRVKLIRRDGEMRAVEIVPTVIHQPGRSPLTVAILRDTTERRRMHDRLSTMRSRLLNLQENERSNIARVLHDTIGQNISILDVNVTTIEELLDKDGGERIADLIAGMRSVIRETGNKLRDIAGGLLPLEVQELGLVAGVSSFIERFRQQTQLEVSTAIKAQRLQVGESVSINMYWIIQEIFTNINKHAKCRSVVFEMRMADGCLIVRVKDDGIGFSPQEVAKRGIDRRGIGLFIIKERVRALRGRLTINSKPGCGTEVQVEVPLTAA